MEDLDNIVLDDGNLLADRLVRSLHRARDGHLATTERQHEKSIELNHNVAVLYVYLGNDKDGYAMHEHYVYSHDQKTYKQWKQVVYREVDKLEARGLDDWHGVFGWQTSYIRVTPLRTGDLFITVDKQGARGVRLSFDTESTKRKNRRRPKHERN